MNNQEKGITLVALIITIIVLLIIAVVTIQAISGDAIINHAENARDSYTDGQEYENTMLSQYELFLAQETGNAWKQNKTKVSKGTTILEVGQTITGNGLPTLPEGITWKVLGAENGNLLLTTSKVITQGFILSASNADWNKEKNEWTGLHQKIDAECANKVAIEGTEAINIRSIQVEDINRVTRYDPRKDSRISDRYGKTYTFQKEGMHELWFFKHPDGRTIGVSPETDVESLIITYNPLWCFGNEYIDISSNAYDLLFTENYWLKNSTINYSSYLNDTYIAVLFSINVIKDGVLLNKIIVDSFDTWADNSGYEVRPVITMSQDFVPGEN